MKDLRALLVQSTFPLHSIYGDAEKYMELLYRHRLFEQSGLSLA